jgi:membrane-associated protease RseP (regulator of RpoE activity)
MRASTSQVVAGLLMLCALLFAGPRLAWAQGAAPPGMGPGWLGVGVKDVDFVEALQAGLPSPAAARIVDVVAGSAAEAAGLQIGDLIVSIDGKPIASADAVAKSIAAKHPGETVPIGVVRTRQPLQLNAVLGQLPEVGAAQPGRDVVQVPLDDACARFFCPACENLDVRLDVPPTTACLQCVTGFADLIAECRRRGGAATPGAAAATPAVPPVVPALELHAVRSVPAQVPAGARFAVEVAFTARNASGAAGPLPVSFSYAIEKGGKTLLEPAPETIEAPSGQSWRIVKNLAATRDAGQYTIRVKLISGNDTVQGSTTLVVN